MDRVHKYISLLLERLPKWELRSYENQTSLDRIRDRISSSSDLKYELKTLFQVNGFGDFALSLMWLAEKAEKEPSLEESSIAEEYFVFRRFKQAVGELSEEEMLTTGLGSFPISGLPSSDQMQTPEVLLESIWNPETNMQSPASTKVSVGIGKDQERNFAGLLEKFLESIQSGGEDRVTLMSSVFNECNMVLSSSGISEEYKNFCQLLNEFLNYIETNQFLDDIRVINIFSNIQDPFAQWVLTDQINRADILEPAIAILRDFKSMFE